MTTKVTKESLAENIGRLEEHQRICREYNAELSINQEYQLKAYRLLIGLLEYEPVHMPYTGGGNFYGYGFHRVGDETFELDIEEVFLAKIKGPAI